MPLSKEDVEDIYIIEFFFNIIFLLEFCIQVIKKQTQKKNYRVGTTSKTEHKHKKQKKGIFESNN